MTNKTRITRRIVNSKRHTLGFILSNGERVTRAKAAQMAARGDITGVTVVNGPNGRYVQSNSTKGLYQLPITRELVKTRSHKAQAQCQSSN